MLKETTHRPGRGSNPGLLIRTQMTGALIRDTYDTQFTFVCYGPDFEMKNCRAYWFRLVGQCVRACGRPFKDLKLAIVFKFCSQLNSNPTTPRLFLFQNYFNFWCSDLAPSFLIGSSSYLQVTRTSITSRTSSKFGQIGPRTAELAALERLEKSP